MTQTFKPTPEDIRARIVQLARAPGAAPEALELAHRLLVQVGMCGLTRQEVMQLIDDVIAELKAHRGL